MVVLTYTGPEECEAIDAAFEESLKYFRENLENNVLTMWDVSITDRELEAYNKGEPINVQFTSSSGEFFKEVTVDKRRFLIKDYVAKAWKEQKEKAPLLKATGQSETMTKQGWFSEMKAAVENANNSFELNIDTKRVLDKYPTPRVDATRYGVQKRTSRPGDIFKKYEGKTR